MVGLGPIFKGSLGRLQVAHKKAGDFGVGGTSTETGGLCRAKTPGAECRMVGLWHRGGDSGDGQHRVQRGGKPGSTSASKPPNERS